MNNKPIEIIEYKKNLIGEKYNNYIIIISYDCPIIIYDIIQKTFIYTSYFNINKKTVNHINFFMNKSRLNSKTIVNSDFQDLLLTITKKQN